MTDGPYKFLVTGIKFLTVGTGAISSEIADRPNRLGVCSHSLVFLNTMPDFYSKVGKLPHVPDDLSLPQFILDHDHPIRPKRPKDVPWLVTDKSGRKMGLDEVCPSITSNLRT